MSEQVHEHANPQKAQIKSTFPKSFIVIIVLVLAAMYYYAASTRPELTVIKYFDAQNNQDYYAEADSLSVFVMAMQLPQYASPNLSGSDLVAQRAEIVNEYAKLISSNPRPSSPAKVEPIKKYTKIGHDSALVVFEVTYQEQKSTGMALLIKEDNYFKLIDLNQIQLNAITIDQIEHFEIEELDQEFAAYLK